MASKPPQRQSGFKGFLRSLNLRDRRHDPIDRGPIEGSTQPGVENMAPIVTSSLFQGGAGFVFNNADITVQNGHTQSEGLGIFQGNSNHVFNYGNFSVLGNTAQEDSSFEGILDQLPTNHNFRSIQIETLEQVTDRTGSWFLDSEEFQGWVDREGEMLWGIGVPGAGKTFLISLVIAYLEGHPALSQSSCSIAFVYCRYSEKITLVEILAALVKQQLERHPFLSTMVGSILARHRLEKTRPSEADLLNMLKEISQRLNRAFYVVDALDELPKDICSRLLELLASVNANIFLTSRPLESMKAFTPNAKYIDIAAHDHDLNLFVAEKIARNPDFSMLLDENGVRHQVISSIVQKCNGRFLHAALQIETLRHCCSLAELEEAMEKLPSRVDELYKSDLKRIDSQPRRHAKLGKCMLVWVMNVYRSITFEDLQFALTFSEETKTFNPKDLVKESLLLSFCCGLLTIDKESRLVRLVHFTAKEVLQPLLSREYPQPDSMIADACISRLISCHFPSGATITSIGDLQKAHNENPLLSYAHDYFGAHAVRCDTLTDLRKRTAQFVRQCHAFPSPLGTYIKVDDRDIDKLNSLHMAAYYNFVDIVTVLLEDKTLQLGDHWDVNTPTAKWGRTALILASMKGNTAAARCLLGATAIDINLTEENGGTALTYAANNGHEPIVRLLLDVDGADVNIASKDGGTALMYAVGHSHEPIVRLLNVDGTDINIANKAGATALMIASMQGHEPIARLLLDMGGIDVNVASKSGWTPLMLASIRGHESIVQLLLDVDTIDVNLTDTSGWTALMLASIEGHESTIQLLLDRDGIDVNISDTWGSTALTISMARAPESVSKVLLQFPGIQTHLADGDGDTALILACDRGHEASVALILETPCSINARTHLEGWTALMFAASKGREGIVTLLLSAPEVEVDLEDNFGCTATEWASIYGHDGVVKLLTQYSSLSGH